MREQLYHATTSDNYNAIQKDGFRNIKNFPTPLVLHHGKRYQKDPGTLGFGLYGFDSKLLATCFGEEKIVDFKICSFEIDILKDNLLDFLDKDDRNRYLEYKKMINSKPIYKTLSKVFSNHGSQSSLEGALLEMYLTEILQCKYKIKILCVRGMTTTQITSSKGSDLANGCEYCIKNTSILISEEE
ncbi:MAG: hypothetical protein JJU16_03250 [Alkalibacterium sp.]|nr:hypothetical protein [Alkalibacterium sp.]